MALRKSGLLTWLLAIVLAGTSPLLSAAAEKGHEGHGHEKHEAHDGHDLHAHHGGVVAEIGETHAELVIGDGKVALYLTDHGGKAIATAGHQAMVLVLHGAERQGPVQLVPAGDNKLEAAAAVRIPNGARAIVTLMDPKGGGAQGRYQLK